MCNVPEFGHRPNHDRRAAVLVGINDKRAVVNAIQVTITIAVLTGIANTRVTVGVRLLAIGSKGTIVAEIGDAVRIDVVANITHTVRTATAAPICIRLVAIGMNWTVIAQVRYTIIVIIRVTGIAQIIAVYILLIAVRYCGAVINKVKRAVVINIIASIADSVLAPTAAIIGVRLI